MDTTTTSSDGFQNPAFTALLGMHIRPCLIAAQRNRQDVTTLYNTPSQVQKQSGIWLVTLDNHSHIDKTGWLVVCWPMLLERLLTYSKVQSYMTQAGIVGDRMSDTDKGYLCLELEKFFREHYTLPGAAFRTDVFPFNKLTQHIPSSMCRDEYSVLIIRMADMSTAPGRTRAIAQANTLNKLSSISKETLQRCPSLLRLLTVVLRRAALEGCSDPFFEWGIAWVSGHLYFHYGRALKALQQDLDYDTGFELEYDAQLSEWADSESFRRVVGVSKNLLLQRSMVADSLAQRDEATALKVMYSDWEQIKYQTEFSDGACAVFNTEKLCDIYKHLMEVSSNPLLLSANTVTTGKKREVVYETALVKIHGEEFLFNHEGPLYLTMFSVMIGSKMYMTVPSEFREATKYLEARYVKQRSTIRLPDINGALQKRFIPRVKLARNARCVYCINGQMYFHVELLKPEGEIHKILEAVYEAKNAENKKPLTAYFKFLRWLEDPRPLIDDIDFIGELRDVVCKEEPNCPVLLRNKSERLNYLHTKGIGYLKDELSSVPAATATDKRSPRFSDYDKYALWRTMEKELPALGHKMSKQQIGEYVSQRWLPWHRPLNITRKVTEKLDLPAMAKRLPNTEDALNNHVAWADDLFGVAS